MERWGRRVELVGPLLNLPDTGHEIAEFRIQIALTLAVLFLNLAFSLRG